MTKRSERCRLAVRTVSQARPETDTEKTVLVFEHVMTASRRVRCLGSVPRCGQLNEEPRSLPSSAAGGVKGWRRVWLTPKEGGPQVSQVPESLGFLCALRK